MAFLEPMVRVSTEHSENMNCVKNWYEEYKRIDHSPSFTFFRISMKHQDEKSNNDQQYDSQRYSDGFVNISTGPV